MPSISPNRPSITITLDKPREFRYTWSSLIRFEEAYGKSLPESFTQNLGLRLINYMAWAGMLPGEPKLTIAQTEARIERYILNGGTIDKLAEDMMRALMESGIVSKAQPVADAEADEGNDQAVSE